MVQVSKDLVKSDPFVAVALPSSPVEGRFWIYRQNNSGGSFNYDDEAGISTYVIVEALSASDADFRAQNFGVYFDDDYSIDCSCCGQRWDRADSFWGSDGGLTRDEMVEEVSHIMGWDLARKWMAEGQPEIFLHMMSGEVFGAWTTDQKDVERG
jgi:hypothetical protein